MEETWLEKTFYTTEEAFPTVLRRSEVVTLEVAEISPLENALQEVEEKTAELAGLHQKYQALAKTAQDVSTNALAMSLNSAVDAPLNTGIASYRQIFFSPDYIARNPERAEMVEKLRSAIDDQVRLFSFVQIIIIIIIILIGLTGPDYRQLSETSWTFMPSRF